MLSSNVGKFVIGGLVTAFVVGGVSYWKAIHPVTPSEKKEAAAKSANNAQDGGAEVTTFESDMPTFKNPPKERIIETQAPNTGRSGPPPVAITNVCFPIKDEITFSRSYACYGRFIHCKLVNTVDSSKIATPIVGLVTESVFSYTGELVIPAGAEVHGFAQLDASRDRIASQPNWVIVMVRDGKEVELNVTGIACDAAPYPDGSGWGITDDSAGLRGDVIKTDNLAEIKLLIATLISGAARNYATQGLQNTIIGSGTVLTSNTGGLKQAAAQGLSDSIGLYAQQIAQAVQRDGVFVRVPGGKDWDLYTTMTIDANVAKIGASVELSKSQTNPNSTPAIR